MKILHVVYDINKKSETFIHNQFEELNNQGFDFSVVTFKKANPDLFPFKVINIPVTKILLSLLLPFFLSNLPFHFYYITKRKTTYKFWIKSNFINLLRFTFILKLLKQYNFNYIHCHFGNIGEYLADVKKFTSAKIIITYYGKDTSVAEFTFYNSSRKYGDLFLVLSEDMKKNLCQSGFNKQKIKVHKLAINISILPKKIKNRKKQILFVGRLVEKKGILNALSAFNLFQNNKKEWKFIIAGNGPLLEQVKEKIEELNLNNKAVCLGFVDHLQVLKLMTKSKMFFLPSRTASDGDREGTPTVIMEAQTLGLPVVSTFHSGIPEIVKNGETALLCEEDNVDEMANALKSLAGNQNKWEKMSNCARNYGLKQFDIEQRIKSLISLYKNI